MKHIFFTSVLTIVMATMAMAQSTNFSGTWYGTTEAGPFSSSYVFHIEHNGDSIAVKFDSPMQKAFGYDVTATINGDTLNIDIPIIQSSYSTTLVGNHLDGMFNSQQDKTYRLRMTHDNAEVTNRPQEAAVLADANKPYHSEDITITNGDITLAGTLTIPNKGKRFPAVVLLTGSGMLDRDENIFGHKGHLLLADALARQGFVVLRYDKRGVGASIGGQCTDPLAQLAEDAMAAVRFAAARPEVDASRVGIVGHSEGGNIAIMNAAKYPDEIAYIVTMAGVGVPGYQISLNQSAAMDSIMGIDHDNPKEHFAEQMYTILGTETDSTALRQRILDLLNTDAYYQNYLEAALAADTAHTASDYNEAMIEAYTSLQACEWLRMDPAKDLKHIKCPMLAVNGALDFQVDSEDNLGAIARYAPHATVKSYENLNHLFQDCSGQDNLLNYAGISETMAPVVINDITAWLKHVAMK